MLTHCGHGFLISNVASGALLDRLLFRQHFSSDHFLEPIRVRCFRSLSSPNERLEAS